MLQQPISHIIGKSRTVLLAGCGDSYDVFGAVPLLVELVLAGRHVHLASLSASYLAGLSGAAAVPSHPNLYKIGAAAASASAYCPEAWLSRWLEEQLGRRQPVWSFERTGVQPLRAAWCYLVEHLAVDCIVLIDTGVASLLRGDERSIGKLDRDLASLCAVAAVDGPRKILACMGMGAGAPGDMNHADVFERMSDLTRAGAFLGTASLLGSTTPGKVYRDAVRYVFDNQVNQKKSPVHELISRAVGGEFGLVRDQGWMSPLMNMLWFFDLAAVARTNLLTGAIETTQTGADVSAAVDATRRSLKLRPGGAIPI